MSGGSMNYIYAKLDSDAIFATDTPERLAFSRHLEKVVRALRDIELVDSADIGEGDENDSIVACVGLEEIERAKAAILERGKQ